MTNRTLEDGVFIKFEVSAAEKVLFDANCQERSVTMSAMMRYFVQAWNETCEEEARGIGDA